MTKAPWITIIGLGEDGPDGLPPASHKALATAEVIMAPRRHLSLLAETTARLIEWPVPFSDGIGLLASLRGQKVVVLASGDPFWFGAGSVIAREFEAGEWRCLPAPSTFSRAASHMGWAIDQTICLGLHAAPLTRLRPFLAPHLQLVVLLRDGDAVHALAQYLQGEGFGESELTVMEALGGPREKCTSLRADDVQPRAFQHPVCVALKPKGAGAVLPVAAGLPDAIFETDGVMTKRPVRAVTLSSLAPKPGELLWDIGGGSGSIGIEWLLAHRACRAISVEPRADRVRLIEHNAAALGVDRLRVVHGEAPDVLTGLPSPDAVFIGGGLSAEMMDALEGLLPAGTRIVANAVTLEAERLLAETHAIKGGELLRIDVSTAQPLGAKTAWKPSYPLVQWSGVL
ncbi:precorrin-6y C5,15-methyltransferase (decarboxylating) subunit CbiE [Roseobacter litoralis]|uniref:precorrin-6y C5,15-methyltransferase (decarboxylating) subunit CbiE n=1 Tax=Roseobacter litoralis TaxID=42443 RepID=UPI0024925A92|nr:precorrin-6y C5,15-methyltransferase (decarboxylating) subunit CbiE [Roseobacter litoralis]